jgi:hypothetical protein
VGGEQVARAEIHALRERMERRGAAAGEAEDGAGPAETGEMRVRAVMVLVGGGITRDTAARLLLHCGGDVQAAVSRARPPARPPARTV